MNNNLTSAVGEAEETHLSPLCEEDVNKQEERLNDIQCALFKASILMEAIHYERIDSQEAHAASYFVAYTLQDIAKTVMNDAVLFAMNHCSAARCGGLTAQTCHVKERIE